MAGKIRKCKCKHCHEHFLPDYRNAKRQKYCGKPECRKASKAASQESWLNKPENKDYFKGPQAVERVRRWRDYNPGYSRRKEPEDALQDPLTVKTTEEQADVEQFMVPQQEPLNVEITKEQADAPKRANSSIQPLQDPLNAETTEEQSNARQFTESALQDLCVAQNPVLVGLIAHFTGSALQGDIASVIQSMQQLGSDILNPPIPTGGRYEGTKTAHRSAHPPNPPVF